MFFPCSQVCLATSCALESVSILQTPMPQNFANCRIVIFNSNVHWSVPQAHHESTDKVQPIAKFTAWVVQLVPSCIQRKISSGPTRVTQTKRKAPASWRCPLILRKRSIIPAAAFLQPIAGPSTALSIFGLAIPKRSMTVQTQ